MASCGTGDSCGAKYTCSSNTVDKCNKGIVDHLTCNSSYSCICNAAGVVINCSECDKTSDLNCNLSDKGGGCTCNSKCYNENCTGTSCDSFTWKCQAADHTTCGCNTGVFFECSCETPYTCPCQGSRDRCTCDSECSCDVGCHRARDNCYECYSSTDEPYCSCNTPGDTCYQCYATTHTVAPCSCFSTAYNTTPPPQPPVCNNVPPKPPTPPTSNCTCQGASNSNRTSCTCNSRCYSEATSCTCDRKCYQFQACQTCDGCNQYQPCSCDAACNVESCAQCHRASYSQPW